MTTEYHSKLFAHELTRQHSVADSEKLAGALLDAQVDLNPHQVEAALFAFKSPLSKGAILADEVGLGKTIEAGLVLAQKWTEGKRRILVITPANLRKQWSQELAEKFYLQSTILEARNYNKMKKDGARRPFEQKALVICSLQFAARNADELMVIPWDLVVIDEAHRLRNVYRPDNRIGRALKGALANSPKVLLTATPLQNSLMELYGLVSLVDDYAFGDAKSFRAQYARLEDNQFDELKDRLKPVCHRTLRRQVLEYIRYTNRIPITQEFVPTQEEQTLYDMVSDYLRRPSLQALPSSQRSLMTLIMRKLLASSTFAIAGALDTLARKLERQLGKDKDLREKLEQELSADFEEFEQTADEWGEDEAETELLTEDDIANIEREIVDLRRFRDLAVSISENAKGQALLSALRAGFAKALELGSAEKTIIFTESRRTQDYLVRLLSANGYDGKLVLFNGSNSDAQSKEIYNAWIERHKGTDRVTGSRTADIRAALVDYFREKASIMVATEAAAEGINLQFCSMVVNYDLPWNPQRIEQRIGRCHRYGQRYDVVVVNFLNKNNAADQRVYELLAEKFKLFSGVFGASDEVLGAIESGVEFEKRIVSIYQNCRSTEEIEIEFEHLRTEMDTHISATMEDTRRKLLEHFDAEVHDRLKINMDQSKEYLDRYAKMLWSVTKHELGKQAKFDDDYLTFILSACPAGIDVPVGSYFLSKLGIDGHRYRLGHPLAQHLIAVAGARKLNGADLIFDYVKLLKTDNKNGIKAQIELHKEGATGPKVAKLWVKQGDDLYRRSDDREAYRDGYIVQNIDCTPGSEYIEFNQGRFLELGQEVGGLGDDIMKAQVYETVEQHLKKERALKGKGIKVLSLFFIDRVANYRIYNEDGTTSLGKIGQWFEEAYKELTAKPVYKELIPLGVADVHNGYFSQDKQGHAKDTRGNTADDDDTYSLIMRDKERLLDPNVALRFIFSHSALREGWDNPNVFQICTLNESKSVERKRQEIGRGLRLPVNETGERVHDETINRLTVIANESYEDFARTLQTEFEEDFGIKFGRVERIAFAKLVRRAEDGAEAELGQDESAKIWGELVANGYLNASGDILEKFEPKNPHFKLEVSGAFADLRAEIADEVNRKLFKNRIVNVRDERTLKFRKEVHLSADFQALWDKIKHRTRYRVTFETSDLIDRALARIKQIEPIKAARVATTVVEVDITDAGVSADRQISSRVRDVAHVKVLPDILAFLQKETELTRYTLAEILKRSGRLGEFKINPQAFMAGAAKEISRALHDLMLEGIKYEKVAGQHWEMSRIEQDAEDGIVRYLGNLYEVQNRNKSLFDAIVYESEVEKQFARDLDSNENVKLFVKLPSWFKIDTPIGTYNPDWAFVTEREEKLYFVRETKSTLDSEERRTKENQKIACGRKHFDSLGVNYDVVTSLAEVTM